MSGIPRERHVTAHLAVYIAECPGPPRQASRRDFCVDYPCICRSKRQCQWLRKDVTAYLQAVHIRHQEQIIRVDHISSDSRQGVIVTEFDFLTIQAAQYASSAMVQEATHGHADGVILIHNRHYAQSQQFRECVLRVQVSLSLDDRARLSEFSVDSSEVVLTSLISCLVNNTCAIFTSNSPNN